MKKTIVVARFNENLDWLKQLPNGWKPLVVQKGKDLPNLGREFSSYFWAIDRLYPDIEDDDVLAFVHGEPFEHSPGLLSYLQSPPEKFCLTGNVTIPCGADGSPHHPGLPVAEKLKQWFGIEWPGQITFTAGGESVVRGKAIRKRPVSFYRDLTEEMNQGENAWAMERLCKYLWS